MLAWLPLTSWALLGLAPTLRRRLNTTSTWLLQSRRASLAIAAHTLCDMATATNCDGLEEYAVLVGATKPFPVTWVSHSWSQLCGFDAGEVRRTPRPNSPAHPKTTRARDPPTFKFTHYLAAGPRPRPQVPAGPGDVEGVDPPADGGRARGRAVLGRAAQLRQEAAAVPAPVSYTHLTLPTILRV